MEAARPAQPDAAGNFMRAVAKIVRFRRAATGKGRSGAEPGTGLVYDDGSAGKAGFSQYLDGGPLVVSPSDYAEEDDEKKRQQQLRHREALESLLAELFAGVSAIKAAYAQIQVAQSPYDPETIQSADAVVVSELKRLSQLKASHSKNRIHGGGGQPSGLDARMLAEAQEQKNLLKTFQITAKKLESDLRRKDSEVLDLKNQILEGEALNRWMEEKLHPRRYLRSLDALHLSALDPTHFLAALRYAVRSIRSFARLMAKETERAGWDLDAAAGAITPEVLKPEHRPFAFESYISRTMFSGFQNHDFGLGGSHCPPLPDRRQFFGEFLELKSAALEEILILHSQNEESSLAKFCRAKYLSLVHPRMEGSFFGNLNQRNLISSGSGFPGTEFFLGLAEVARRVWLLHRLFFSFGQEARASIFQVGRGSRFSEVYMESALEDADVWSPVVGFTVVPGFTVRKTVIQCRIYPRGRRSGVEALDAEASRSLDSTAGR